MANKIVKTLIFPGDTDGYQINAVALDGKTKNDFLSTSGGTVSGDLEVTGTLTVQGEGILSHLENVTTEQNTITLRKNAEASLGTNEYTGIVAKKYDGTNDGMLVFDKDGTAYVGDSGDIQPLATRAPESALTDKHLLMWDASNHRITDSNDIVVHLDGGTARSAW